MKKKLIAAVLSITVIAGVGAVVYNTNNDKDNIEITEQNNKIVQEKSLDNKTTNKDNTIDNSDNQEKSGQTVNESTLKANADGQNNQKTEVTPQENSKVPSQVQEKPVAPPVTEKPVTPPVIQEPVAPPVANSQFMAEVEQAIFNMVNQERAKAGVPGLSYNNTMQHYARIKSQDMGERNYFDHANPEGEYITAQMQRDGVSYQAWGENIAYIGGVSDANALASQFMNNWMNSDGHRKNILSTNFSSIGVGVVKVGNKVYATQEFYR